MEACADSILASPQVKGLSYICSPASGSSFKKRRKEQVWIFKIDEEQLMKSRELSTSLEKQSEPLAVSPCLARGPAPEATAA